MKTEISPAVQLLKALGKTKVYLRSWVGKGFDDVPKLGYKDEYGNPTPGRAYKVSEYVNGFRKFDWDIEDPRWIQEATRQNSAQIKPAKSYPYQYGGFCPYFVVNSGGHKQAEIIECHALFCEFDAPITKEEALSKLEAFPLRFSALVESRNGYHAYWFLKTATSPSLWRNFQWRLIEQFDSDAGIEDPSRVMRLPGFKHLQAGADPFAVDLLSCDADVRYSLEDFDKTLPPIPDWRLKLSNLPEGRREFDDSTDPWDIRDFAHNLTGYRPRARREWDTCKCPVHNGNSKNSLHINSQTGAYKCWNGCDPKDIYAEVCRLAGVDPKRRKAKEPARLKNLIKKSTEDPGKEQGTSSESTEEKPAPKTPDPEAEITHEELVNRIREYESQYGMGTSKYDFALYQLAKQIRIPKTAIEGIYLKSIADSVKREILPISELSDRHNTDTVREWLIERFLPKGTTCLLYADGGVGKTLLVYDLIKSLHERDSFLDRRIVYRPKTLLIQTDEPEIDMLQRFRDKGMDRIPNLFVTTEWTFGEIVNLKRTIEQEKYELVIIDSFASANRQALTEEKDAMHAAVLYELRNFANFTNCTIIVLHHTNKTGQARGSTAIRNNVSECWKLRKHDPNTDPFKMASDERILQVEKSRSGVIQKLIVSLNEDLDFEFVDDLQKRLEGGDSVPATWTERILAYFQNNTEAEETALSLPERWSLNGLKVENAKKTLRKLHSKGTLELIGKESNSKGEASPIYRLACARQKNVPGFPVSPKTLAEQGKHTGNDTGNDTGNTGKGSIPGKDSHTGTDQKTFPVSFPVTDPSPSNGSSSYRETGKQGQAHVRESDPPKARALGSLNQYTGPAIGSVVQLDPTDVDPKKIKQWRAKGSDLPWGMRATVIEVGSTGSRYVVTVELPDKRRFVVDDLNALGEV